MLVFIGGAARTGKGILVRRLLLEMQMSYLSIDVLKMGLARGAPEYGLDPDAGCILVAEKLWPLVREMSVSLLAEDMNYAMEGELLPQHVAALRQAYPAQIKACFLGYATITPTQKLHDIRIYSGHPNDWPSTYTDAALLNIITREIAFSQYLMDACAKHSVRYFDTSRDFAQTLEQVVAYVRAEQ
ncbi:MAG: hypothetical protein ABIV47_07705 [Roseiflexaceae bacterium]